MGRIRLVTIPAEDAVLRQFASRALASRAQTPRALERLLRLLYPEVHARPQNNLAAVGAESVWYVFRDTRYQRPGGGDWWHADGSGRAVLDDAGKFVDVDETAASLLGVVPVELLGRSARAFYPPQLDDWFDDIVPILRREGVAMTRWLIYRPDGTTAYTDVRLVNDEAGSHRHGVAFNPVTTGAIRDPAAS
jgi:PAS domain S-box-containing protein